MTAAGLSTAEIKLPDRVRAARLLNSSGEVAIVRSAPAVGAGRSTFEGCAMIRTTEPSVFDWLQRNWGRHPLDSEGWQNGSHWLVMGGEARGFLQAVQQFSGAQKAWIETTLAFLEFQQLQLRRYDSQSAPAEVYLHQVSMFERQQSLMTLEAGRPRLRVIDGLLD